MPIDIQINTPGATPALLQQDIEVPKEIKEMSFSSDTIPDLTGTGETITTDKGIELKTTKTEEEKKTETEVKPEVKPEDKKVEQKKEEKKPEVKTEEVKKEEKTAPKKEEKAEDKGKIKQITPVKEKKQETETDTFDYTKYSPQEQTNMKNMSRQSREAYVKLLDENRQLASLKDSNYLQHELGYTLSPEYQSLRGKETAVFSEGKAWENALLAIKAGKEFQEPVGIDEKTGRLIMSAMKKANDADEIRISQNLGLCVTELNKVRGELGGYGERFKHRIQQDTQEIQNERANRFAWVSDPKLLDATVEVGEQNIPVKQIISNFKQLLPPYQRNSIVADVAADLFVALQIQNAQLKEAQKGTTVAEIKAKEAARGEPTSEENERGDTTIKKINGKAIPSKFSLEGMPE